MEGNTYKIDRLSRRKVHGEYTPIAIIVLGDYSMNAFDNTEFIIFLDGALSLKEVEIIK
jgi:hypothetical protein